MVRFTLCTILLAGAAAVSPVRAGTPSIGIASNVATYTLNDQIVTGDAPFAADAVVRTTIAPSDIQLESGPHLLLATRSEGRFGAASAVLATGGLRVENFADYPVHVDNLEIVADSPAARAVISRTGRNVEITSLDGSVRVTDGGVLMTRVASGTKMLFQTQTAAPSQTPTLNAATQQSQTGANPADKGGFNDRDERALLWTIAAIAGAALLIGSIAIAQGKSL